MLAGVDLTKPHEIEGARRSIAMLPPEANALRRDGALTLLEALRDLMRPEQPRN